MLRGWRRVDVGLVTVGKAIYVSNPTATPVNPLFRMYVNAFQDRSVPKAIYLLLVLVYPLLITLIPKKY